jgi:glycosyltransferase involved in cell wall biosynthesis
VACEACFVKPTICIVAHNAYGALNGAHRGHLGGVEIQSAAFAKWLAGRGYDTSIVTWADNGPDDEILEGVRVVKTCKAVEGVPGLRFVHPRMSSLVASLRRANADIYYHNCAESHTGVIAAWCALTRRTFVYSSASEADCRWARPAWQPPHAWLLYRFGRRAANLVITQTQRQVEMLDRECGIRGVVVPMPGALNRLAPATVADWRQRRSRGGVVLWVGRIDPRKRLEHLFAIARQMPDTTFRVVAPFSGFDDYDGAIEAEGRGLANIDWMGRVDDRERMSVLYRDADCLCCTSLFEGFPNTFLEAWSHGLPVVSSFDPDDLIAARRLGMRADTVPEFVAALETLMTSESEWHEMSRNAIQHYQDHHHPEAALPRFEAALLDAWARR